MRSCEGRIGRVERVNELRQFEDLGREDDEDHFFGLFGEFLVIRLHPCLESLDTRRIAVVGHACGYLCLEGAVNCAFQVQAFMSWFMAFYVEVPRRMTGQNHPSCPCL